MIKYNNNGNTIIRYSGVKLVSLKKMVPNVLNWGQTTSVCVGMSSKTHVILKCEQLLTTSLIPFSQS